MSIYILNCNYSDVYVFATYLIGLGYTCLVSKGSKELEKHSRELLAILLWPSNRVISADANCCDYINIPTTLEEAETKSDKSRFKFPIYFFISIYVE
ncbi:hypothetical protein H8356DRAFT_1416701 [Neocallimastix lanati (nom. inval.)]|nr:hypothetical protein H8356DRAFT_1416701 [Neocallimastix sp. JGI-2020a]